MNIILPHEIINSIVQDSFWEDYEEENKELEEEFVEKRPEDCICSDKTFESYGCMCRRTISPGLG